MPTKAEMIPNRPLNGQELKQLILNDVAAVLNRDGMFREHMGYGRISYRVSIYLHLDNPSYPEHVIQLDSKPASKQEIQRGADNRTNAAFPLAEPVTGEAVHGLDRERSIDSPNQARLEANMPVTVLHRDPKTGHMKEDKIHVSNDNLPPTPVKDYDTTEEAEKVTGAAKRSGRQVTVVE